MRYAISRSGQYDIQSKLTWMIDTLLQRSVPMAEAPDAADSVPDEIEMVNTLRRHMLGERIKKSKLTQVASLADACLEIASLSDLISEAAEHHQTRVLLHTDAVQAAGKLSLNVDELAVDLMSLSGHKIYGPKGVGALYVRRGVEIDPLIAGGGQENQRRSGTENVALITGFGEALALAEQERAASRDRMGNLSNRLIAGINKRIPNAAFNGSHSDTSRVPEIANFSFPGVEGEPVLLGLDFKGIAASSGSACSSASLEPSHVLLAMGVSPDLAVGSVRLSMGRDTTESDIDDVLEALTAVLDQLGTYPVGPSES